MDEGQGPACSCRARWRRRSAKPALERALTLPLALSLHRFATGYIIMIWIALSSSVILQNAYILRSMRFNYPIALTTWSVPCSLPLRTCRGASLRGAKG